MRPEGRQSDLKCEDLTCCVRPKDGGNELEDCGWPLENDPADSQGRSQNLSCMEWNPAHNLKERGSKLSLQGLLKGYGPNLFTFRL